MVLLHVLASSAGIGLLEGSEIAMLTIAAAAMYKWKKAWKATFAALATMAPLLVVLYSIFTSLPQNLATLLAGVVIFVLGAHFFIEGFHGRKENEKEAEKEEREKISAGLVSVYFAILLEEAEAGSIIMSIGAAASDYVSAVLGMVIGVAIPLIAIRNLQPFLEKVPEWVVQFAVGAIMMIVASLIILYHF